MGEGPSIYLYSCLGWAGKRGSTLNAAEFTTDNVVRCFSEDVDDADFFFWRKMNSKISVLGVETSKILFFRTATVLVVNLFYCLTVRIGARSIVLVVLLPKATQDQLLLRFEDGGKLRPKYQARTLLGKLLLLILIESSTQEYHSIIRVGQQQQQRTTVVVVVYHS